MNKSKKEHHFEIEDAEEYGIPKAILLYNLKFWLDKNKANESNIHSKNKVKYYWTYNSGTAFEKLFPYMKSGSINTWLNELEKDGVILSGKFNKYKYDKTKWYTIPNEYYIPIISESNPIKSESIPTISEPIPYNKQHIINTDISDDVDMPVQERSGQLPDKFGKAPLTRITHFYADLWKDTYGTQYEPNYKQIGGQYKKILEKLTECQIAMLMIKHFNWYGGSGEDQFVYKNLDNNFFPISWIPSKINEYTTYLKNVEKVDFDNEEEIKEYINNHYKTLDL